MRRTILQDLRWMLNESCRINYHISELLFYEINEVSEHLTLKEIEALELNIKVLIEEFKKFKEDIERV